MPEFIYKRTVHKIEYYRIEAETVEEAYKAIEINLDSLEDGLTMYQEEYYPADLTIALEHHENVEEVDAIPESDQEDEEE